MKNINIIKLFMVFTIPLDVESTNATIEGSPQAQPTTLKLQLEERALEVESAIRKVEDAFTIARKQFSDANVLHSVTELLKLAENPGITHYIIKQKAVERIVIPNLPKHSNDIKKHLLILMKVLFQGDHKTANELVHPNNVIDILTVLEKSDNSDVQKQALDILHLWLIGNPAAQTVVAQFRTLDTFYQIMKNLEPESRHSLLELFRKMLQEHIEIRTEKNIGDLQLRQYVRIGLLEHISTPRVCNVLLDIYKTALMHSTNNFKKNLKSDVITIFKLIDLTKEFCIQHLKSNPKASAFFKKLKRQLGDMERREYLEYLNVNVKEIEDVVDYYIEKLHFRRHPQEL